MVAMWLLGGKKRCWTTNASRFWAVSFVRKQGHTSFWLWSSSCIAKGMLEAQLPISGLQPSVTWLLGSRQEVIKCLRFCLLEFILSTRMDVFGLKDWPRASVDGVKSMIVTKEWEWCLRGDVLLEEPNLKEPAVLSHRPCLLNES